MDRSICNAALMHHEKCDGSGYPFGLQAEQIDRYGKLVAVADIYDAMTSDRVYRSALPPFEVIRLFEDEGLYRYDVRYVMTFLQRVADTYLNEWVRLNDGREGTDRLYQPSADCKTYGPVWRYIGGSGKRKRSENRTDVIRRGG